MDGFENNIDIDQLLDDFELSEGKSAMQSFVLHSTNRESRNIHSVLIILIIHAMDRRLTMD